MTLMKQSWRWFGEEDSVTLSDIQQAGATDVVTALHHIPNGNIWPLEDIQKRQEQVQRAGLKWSVVESVPVHEDIKKQTGSYKSYIDNYKQTLCHLAQCGIRTICYNFMPILDWTRTDLYYPMPDGSKALSFDIVRLALFDIFILNRKNAYENYNEKQVIEAEKIYSTLGEIEKTLLTKTILAGLPGSEENYSLQSFKRQLAEYETITKEDLRSNLLYFLDEVIPEANKLGVNMAIHPDDPPFDIFGIPRIVSTESDLENLFNKIPLRENGLTFCTGSLGARFDNDLLTIFRRFADRIHFIHLRNVQVTNELSFYEANHLEGRVNMYEIVKEIIHEQQRRASNQRSDSSIPMRPDHGHQMLDDLKKVTNPGYSAIGRLRGLAELRGLELGIYHGLLQQQDHITIPYEQENISVYQFQKP